ncbi:hypothetical protein [Hansschlegelia sp.]|uniref:hypothetical protein n=1 Tax=Hansschlegelia sp. TaxID=2041892 RepID=UPI002C7D3836|nr:hypothetical protein [Hansschlegelia sp.]HVI28177.1 hypothetical protein [Hansschlegelia sp.]
MTNEAVINTPLAPKSFKDLELSRAEKSRPGTGSDAAATEAVMEQSVQAAMASGDLTFDSREDAEATAIPADVTRIVTKQFYSTRRGGGAVYVRGGASRPTTVAEQRVSHITNPTFSTLQARPEMSLTGEWTLGQGWTIDGLRAVTKIRGPFAFLQNHDSFTSLNSDELYACAVNADGQPVDRDITFNFGGADYTIPRGTVWRQDNLAGTFYLVADLSGAWPGTAAMRIAVVQKTGSTWQFDNNSGWVTFTPNTNHVIVGALTASSTSIVTVTGNPTPSALTAGSAIPTLFAVSAGDVIFGNSGLVAGAEYQLRYKMKSIYDSQTVDTLTPSVSFGESVHTGDPQKWAPADGYYTVPFSADNNGNYTVKFAASTNFQGSITEAWIDRIITEPGAFRDADGAWWRLDVPVADVRCFGAFAGADATTNRTAIQDALVWAAQIGERVAFVPTGTFQVDGDLRIMDDTTVIGAGPRATTVKLVAPAASTQNLWTNDRNFKTRYMAAPNRGIRMRHIGGHGNVRRLMLDRTSYVFSTPLELQPGNFIERTLTHANYGTGDDNGRVQGYLDLPDGDEIDGISIRTYRAAGSFTCRIINTTDLPITIPADSSLVGGRYNYNGGGASSGCVFGFANVQSITIEDCWAGYAAKHCNDVSASLFDIGDTSAGDGPGSDPVILNGVDDYPPYPSRYVVIRDCHGTQGGDDILSTHGSEWVLIENFHAYNGGGTLVLDNSNGIEIDDSTRYATVINCLCVNTQAAIEIKGHDKHPAANHVWVEGLRCLYTRSAAIDHHHIGGTPGGGWVMFSKIYTKNCWRSTYLYHYHNTILDGFHFEDTGWTNQDNNTSGKWFSTNSEAIIDIENGANHVIVQNGRMDITTAARGIYIQDGNTDRVIVQNVIGHGGLQAGIYTGSQTSNMIFDNIILTRPVADTPTEPSSYGFDAYNAPSSYVFETRGCRFPGYKYEARTGRGGDPLIYPAGGAVDFKATRADEITYSGTGRFLGYGGRNSNGQIGGFGWGAAAPAIYFDKSLNAGFLFGASDPTGNISALPNSLYYRTSTGVLYLKGSVATAGIADATDWRVLVRYAAPDAGWTAGTGTPNKGAFAANTATLAQTAQRVLALENAVRAANIIT